MEDSSAGEKETHEGRLSIVMLVVTALFITTILVIPGKLASRSDVREENKETASYLPNVSGDIPTYSIPLNMEIRMPISSTYVFKVVLVSDEIVEGKVVEGGGSCFVFYVLDEAAYNNYIRSGSSSLTKDGGRVYISATPVHYRMEFTIVPDRTGDYYAVLVSPPGSCRGKIVSIELKR